MIGPVELQRPCGALRPSHRRSMSGRASWKMLLQRHPRNRLTSRCTRSPAIAVCRPPPNYYGFSRGVGRGMCWVGAARNPGTSVSDVISWSVPNECLLRVELFVLGARNQSVFIGLGFVDQSQVAPIQSHRAWPCGTTMRRDDGCSTSARKPCLVFVFETQSVLARITRQLRTR